MRNWVRLPRSMYSSQGRKEKTNRSDVGGTGDAARSASEQRGTEEVDKSAEHGNVVAQVRQAGESANRDCQCLEEGAEKRLYSLADASARQLAAGNVC